MSFAAPCHRRRRRRLFSLIELPALGRRNRAALTMIELPAVSGRKRAAFTIVELPAVSGRKRAAFTLVELIVVIGIIAVLLALLMPTLRAVHESSRTLRCASQLRQIGQGI